MKTDKILIISLGNNIQPYFSNHIKLLSQNSRLIIMSPDKHKVISKFFSRRSFLTLPLELISFYIYIMLMRPNYIITAGPKIGLLTSIACFFTFGVSSHLHWFTGQVWANKKNYMLSSGFISDKIISILTKYLLCDGESQKKFLVNKLNIKKEIHVPENGSINGINSKFFLTKKEKTNEIITCCYVGRLTEEKGLNVFFEVAKLCSELHLKCKFIVAGPLDDYFNNFIEWKENFLALNNTQLKVEYVDPIEIFSISDVLLFPSKREGFGSVVIEAQASGLVVLASDIYGLKNSFIENVTGYTCQNSYEYVNYLKIFLNDTEKLCSMKKNAVEFSTNFRDDIYINSLENLYDRILKKRIK